MSLNSKFHIPNSTVAFTLIEFAIYIAVASGLATAAGAIALNALFAKTKLAAVEEVASNGRFALEIITGRIERARNINNPAAGLSASTLSLQMSNAGADPTEFDLSSGRLRMREGTGAFVELTSDEVTVTNLVFRNLSHFSTPGAVRMQITVETSGAAGQQEYAFGETFFGAAALRGN